MIVLFLIVFSSHAQIKLMDWFLYDKDLRHGRVNCTWWFKYWAYNLLYIQYSPTIYSFFFSIWNPYQVFSSFDCFCNIRSLLLFHVTVDPCMFGLIKSTIIQKSLVKISITALLITVFYLHFCDVWKKIFRIIFFWTFLLNCL